MTLLVLAMVFMQCSAAYVLFETVGSREGTCVGHEDCGAGYFCSPEAPMKATKLLTSSGADLGTCRVCKSLNWMVETYKCHANGTARDPQWESACGACTSRAGRLLEDGRAYLAKLNIDRMSSSHWLIYLMVATLAVGVVQQEARKMLKVVVVVATGTAGGAGYDAADVPRPIARCAMLTVQYTRCWMMMFVAGNVPLFVLCEREDPRSHAQYGRSTALVRARHGLVVATRRRTHGPQHRRRADACEQACGIGDHARREGRRCRDDAWLHADRNSWRLGHSFCSRRFADCADRC